MAQSNDTLSVSKAAFLAYGEDVPFGERRYRNDVTKEPDNVKISTSLDNIASEDDANMVESMKIDIYYAKDPFPGLLNVTKYLQEKAWVLNKAVKLEVGIHPECFWFKMDIAEINQHDDDMAKFSKAVHQLLPNVTNINIGGVNNNPAARMIFGNLAGYYADQLLELHSQNAIIVSEDIVFEKLQRVYINADSYNDYTLPRMNPSALESLRVFNGPAAHSWMPLADASNSSTIEFSNLKEVHMAYKRINSRDSRPEEVVSHDPNVKLSFPKLETLRVTGATGKCALITAATYPLHLKSVDISAAPAEFEMLSQIKLPAADRIEISVDRGEDNEGQALQHVNQMLCNSGTSKQVRLQIDNDELTVLASDITCLSLTNLLLHSPTGVDTLIGILDKLPNLNGLTFYNLALDPYESDLSIPELGQHQEQRMVPFNTKLASIALNYDYEKYTVDAMVAVVTYLLLRLPMIEMFIIPQTPERPVFDFVDKFTELYPHLGKVGFRLKLESDPDFEPGTKFYACAGC